MSLAVVLEQFLNDLPGLVSQARRQIYCNNLNIQEYFSRKLQDALNILNIFGNRCEDINAPRNLILEIRRVTDEIQTVYRDIEDVISTDRDYVLELNSPGVVCLLEDARHRVGRPRLAIDKSEVERLYDIHLSWERVADILGISSKTLLRRRIELGLDVSNTTGPRLTYTDISDDELCSVVRIIYYRGLQAT